MRTNTKTRDMIMIALFATLTTVGAYISIPLGAVPFTFQTLFVMLSGLILGSKKGFMAMLVYVLMGLVGIPVFANGLAGIAIVFKPTFGYLIGFILASYVIGLVHEKTNHFVFYFIAPFIGLIVIYLVGVPYLYYIFNTIIYPETPINALTALKYGFFPFIVFDLIKAALAGFVGMSVIPVLEKIR